MPSPQEDHHRNPFRHRRLPHFKNLGSTDPHIFFLTFRLAGTLPPGRCSFHTTDKDDAATFTALDTLLDRATHGPTYLQIPDLASIITTEFQNTLNPSTSIWTIMPNHVHILAEIPPPVSKQLPSILRTIKGRTARFCNQHLGIQGKPFWQDETCDRLVRDGHEYNLIARYIENNPVKAGLVSTPELHPWTWSRAWYRAAGSLPKLNESSEQRGTSGPPPLTTQVE
jgi:REP element-mobilizing transposase RayT